MLPLTSTMMTMSLGEVAAWMYLDKKRNTRNHGESVEWRISGHTHLGDVSHSMTCTVSMAMGPAVQQQEAGLLLPASPSGSSLFTHGQELGQLQTYVQVSAKSDNCYHTI